MKGEGLWDGSKTPLKAANMEQKCENFRRKVRINGMKSEVLL